MKPDPCLSRISNPNQLQWNLQFTKMSETRQESVFVYEAPSFVDQVSAESGLSHLRTTTVTGRFFYECGLKKQDRAVKYLWR